MATDGIQNTKKYSLKTILYVREGYSVDFRDIDSDGSRPFEENIPANSEWDYLSRIYIKK